MFNSETLQINTLLSDYVKIRAERAEAEKILKQVKKREEEISEQIMDFMEATGGGSRVAPSGHTVSEVMTRYPSYEDPDAVMIWAERYGNDYVQKVWLLLDMKAESPEDIFTMQPNKKLVTALLKHFEQLAAESNTTMEDLLPPGLQQSVKRHLRLTAPKQDAKEKIGEGSGSLLEMAKRGALKKETV